MFFRYKHKQQKGNNDKTIEFRQIYELWKESSLKSEFIGKLKEQINYFLLKPYQSEDEKEKFDTELLLSKFNKASQI